MKKVLLLLIMVIILVSGCENKLTSCQKIDYNEFNKMIENKDNFILFIGSSSCPHCNNYTVTLNHVIKKHQILIYYLDITTLSKKQNKDFSKLINFKGTPTTVFIFDGKEKNVYNRINGAQGYDKVIKKLKENKYIK